jgi:hypothetical protein
MSLLHRISYFCSFGKSSNPQLCKADIGNQYIAHALAAAQPVLASSSRTSPLKQKHRMPRNGRSHNEYIETAPVQLHIAAKNTLASKLFSLCMHYQRHTR